MGKIVVTNVPAMQWFSKVFLQHLLKQERISVVFADGFVELSAEHHGDDFLYHQFCLDYFYRARIAPLSYVDAWMRNTT